MSKYLKLAQSTEKFIEHHKRKPTVKEQGGIATGAAIATLLDFVGAKAIKGGTKMSVVRTAGAPVTVGAVEGLTEALQNISVELGGRQDSSIFEHKVLREAYQEGVVGAAGGAGAGVRQTLGTPKAINAARVVSKAKKTSENISPQEKEFVDFENQATEGTLAEDITLATETKESADKATTVEELSAIENIEVQKIVADTIPKAIEDSLLDTETKQKFVELITASVQDVAALTTEEGLAQAQEFNSVLSNAGLTENTAIADLTNPQIVSILTSEIMQSVPANQTMVRDALASQVTGKQLATLKKSVNEYLVKAENTAKLALSEQKILTKTAAEQMPDSKIETAVPSAKILDTSSIPTKVLKTLLRLKTPGTVAYNKLNKYSNTALEKARITADPKLTKVIDKVLADRVSAEQSKGINKPISGVEDVNYDLTSKSGRIAFLSKALKQPQMTAEAVKEAQAYISDLVASKEVTEAQGGILERRLARIEVVEAKVEEKTPTEAEKKVDDAHKDLEALKAEVVDGKPTDEQKAKFKELKGTFDEAQAEVVAENKANDAGTAQSETIVEEVSDEQIDTAEETAPDAETVSKEPLTAMQKIGAWIKTVC